MGYLTFMLIYTAVQRSVRRFPLASARIAAGFPSPADDHLEGELDLNELLIQNAPATFFVRARGESMHRGNGVPIQDGDLLIVDKSRTPKTGDVIIACIDNQFTVKRLLHENGEVWLLPENISYPKIRIEEGNEFVIWGVVTARVSQFH